MSVQAGNNKIDLELAEKQAKERARAEFKAAMLAKRAALAAQVSSAQSEDPSSGVPAHPGADSDHASDEVMEVEAESATHSAESAKDKEMKKKLKAEKSEARSKDAKAAQKQRKLNKAQRKDEKKERRQKKEEIREARKAK